jgi:hypothetical protein
MVSSRSKVAGLGWCVLAIYSPLDKLKTLFTKRPEHFIYKITQIYNMERLVPLQYFFFYYCKVSGFNGICPGVSGFGFLGIHFFRKLQQENKLWSKV